MNDKLTVAGINPPNSTMNPYVSIHIPIKGNPINTTVIPIKKAKVAFSLCLWKKKLYVLENPIIHVNPLINKI